jgi:two-component system LytT family response regulator
MTKIRTIVVDDEFLALGLLCSYLDTIPEIEIVARCKNGSEAIEAATSLEPDLMFLDIQMPGMTGFDVAVKLQSDLMPLVIFATAYDQYALDAFEIHAVDYVLKPLDQKRIGQAVGRAIKRLAVENDATDTKHDVLRAMDERAGLASAAGVDEVRSGSLSSTDRLGKIVIKDRDTINLISQESIAWVDAAGDYMCIHAEGETHIMRSTMKSLLEQLDDSLFKRVHRSTIVNLKHIQQVFPHTKGECFLLLGENDRIKVSRNYRDVIKEFLAEV